MTICRSFRVAHWLRAGTALQHVPPLANRAHVRSSLLHRAVEWPDLRHLLQNPHTAPGHVQMVVRLGYGPRSTGSPRATAHLD